MNPVARTQSLGVLFGRRRALSDVTIEVEAGTSLAVIGPNGSGKSTLLGALAGTIEVSSGLVSVSGRRPAFVMQSTDVDQSLPITAWDTVALGRYATLGILRRFGTSDRKAVRRALERLSVLELADRKLRELSGGQRQRVLVAQGVAQESGLLLLDEPLTGLDVSSQLVIHRVMDEEVATGRAVIMTTHDLDDARRCDRVLLLDGAPVAYGSPAEVLTEEHLQSTFGGRFMRVGDEFVLDDPHHRH